MNKNALINLTPRQPHNEAARLNALREYDILDTPAEEAFDRITRLAMRLLDVPIALITLIDEDRQWFKSCYGTDLTQTGLEISFCAHAILQNDVMVISDTTQDKRFADYAVVTDAPFIRFYAGAPLTSATGYNLGTLCIVDIKPRQLNESEKDTLRDLAAIVMDELELRLAHRAAQADMYSHLEAKVEERTTLLAKANAQLRKEITERYRYQDELKQSESRFRALIENAQDIITVLRAGGTVEYESPAIKKVLGYDPEELVGRNIFELIHAEDREMVTAQFQQLLEEETNTVAPVTFRFLHQNGSWRYLESTGSKPEVHAATTTIVVNSRDVTARKKDEAALEAAGRENNRLAAAIENSTTGVLISDPFESDNPAIFVNRAFTMMTGYTQKDILGLNCRFLQGDETDPDVVQQMRLAIQKQESFKGTLLNYRKDGTSFWNDLTINPVFDENGQLIHFVGLQTDVTERVHIGIALNEAKDEAERANLSKSEFLSRMSHELRTPLNGILGFAQLLEMDPLNDEQRESVEYILTGGKHLLNLINEVLDIARVESGHVSISLETVNVIELICETADSLLPLLARRNIELDKSQLSKCQGCAYADRQRLKQILVNLLSNAIKYNRDGGKIILSCEEVAKQKLKIHVQDTGPGISADDVQKIFTPFERLTAGDSSIEGSGIGLAFSQRLAELMNGVIEVESKLGVGSTFTVVLPLSATSHQE